MSGGSIRQIVLLRLPPGTVREGIMQLFTVPSDVAMCLQVLREKYFLVVLPAEAFDAYLMDTVPQSRFVDTSLQDAGIEHLIHVPLFEWGAITHLPDDELTARFGGRQA